MRQVFSKAAAKMRSFFRKETMALALSFSGLLGIGYTGIQSIRHFGTTAEREAFDACLGRAENCDADKYKVAADYMHKQGVPRSLWIYSFAAFYVGSDWWKRLEKDKKIRDLSLLYNEEINKKLEAQISLTEVKEQLQPYLDAENEELQAAKAAAEKQAEDKRIAEQTVTQRPVKIGPRVQVVRKQKPPETGA